MKQLADKTVSERQIRVSMDWAELNDLIGRAILNELDVEQAEIKVSIEQEKEGSPSYTVQRWKVIADVKVPLR